MPPEIKVVSQSDVVANLSTAEHIRISHVLCRAESWKAEGNGDGGHTTGGRISNRLGHFRGRCVPRTKDRQKGNTTQLRVRRMLPQNTVLNTTGTRRERNTKGNHTGKPPVAGPQPLGDHQSGDVAGREPNHHEILVVPHTFRDHGTQNKPRLCPPTR